MDFDSEDMVLECLREKLGTVQSFFVDIPHGWDDQMPVTVVTKIAGDAYDPRYLELCTFTAATFAPDRKQASNNARAVQRALFTACRENWMNAEGVMFRFVNTKSPVEVRDGLTGKHFDTFMFDGTYTIYFRSRNFHAV